MFDPSMQKPKAFLSGFNFQIFFTKAFTLLHQLFPSLFGWMTFMTFPCL
jgi:hypothetical protein